MSQPSKPPMTPASYQEHPLTSADELKAADRKLVELCWIGFATVWFGGGVFWIAQQSGNLISSQPNQAFDPAVLFAITLVGQIGGGFLIAVGHLPLLIAAYRRIVGQELFWRRNAWLLNRWSPQEPASQP